MRWCNNLNSGSLSEPNESFVPSTNDTTFSNNEIERISSNVRVKDLTGGLEFANVVSIDGVSFEDGRSVTSFLDRNKRDIHAWNWFCFRFWFSYKLLLNGCLGLWLRYCFFLNRFWCFLNRCWFWLSNWFFLDRLWGRFDCFFFNRSCVLLDWLRLLRFFNHNWFRSCCLLYWNWNFFGWIWSFFDWS